MELFFNFFYLQSLIMNRLTRLLLEFQSFDLVDIKQGNALIHLDKKGCFAETTVHSYTLGKSYMN